MRPALPLLVLFAACGSDPTPAPIDAGPPDAQPSDMSVDGNLADMFVLDEGVDGDAGTDASTVDAGPSCPDSTCPAPGAGMLTVCGYVFDLESSRRIEDGAVAVRLYDALSLFADTSSPPIAVTTSDACGFFRIVDAARPSLGYSAVVVDDAAASDVRVTTAVVFPSPTSAAQRVDALSLARTTDSAWSAAAGLAASFGTRGAGVLIFTDPRTPAAPPIGETESPLSGAPVAGVSPTVGGSPAAPANTFYFSDLVASELSTIATGASATAANGSVVMLNSSLVEHSGSGGEPAGCVWESKLSGTAPGLVVVTELSATCP